MLPLNSLSACKQPWIKFVLSIHLLTLNSRPTHELCSLYCLFYQFIQLFQLYIVYLYCKLTSTEPIYNPEPMVTTKASRRHLAFYKVLEPQLLYPHLIDGSIKAYTKYLVKGLTRNRSFSHDTTLPSRYSTNALPAPDSLVFVCLLVFNKSLTDGSMRCSHPVVLNSS